jgi:hypothetical protein
MVRNFLLLILLASLPTALTAQDLDNIRVRRIPVLNDTIYYDSLATVAGSMTVTDSSGSVVHDTVYQVLPWESAFLPKASLQKSRDHLYLKYRVMPISLTNRRFHKDIDQIRHIPEQVFTWQKLSRREDPSPTPFPSAGIIHSGSISRAITMGNNQDAVVNSGMDLQLSGQLGNNLNINGVLSDQNIPIQPDGTTQKINELDRVYLQVYNDQTRVTGGDFEISEDQGYFMRLNKKVQGASVRHHYHPGGEVAASSTISGAVSQGKSCRKSFRGEEGNQGPYRLTGCNGETHIIILSGSERVYIDGKLMQRGKNNDYTINYNTAEITFTPNRLITKNKRVQVEFEYSMREYTRFMAYTRNTIKTNRGALWLNVYTQKDSKGQTLARDLTDSHKQLLSQVGDDLDKAVVPYIDTAVTSVDPAIRYIQKDTIVGGKHYSVYTHSEDSRKEALKVGFSYAGSNGGHYRLKKSAANGRIYQWVAPVEGVPQGSYTPMRQLIPPQKQQMLTFGGEGKLSPTLGTSFELAMSNRDLNTFSSLDQSDNKGYALQFNMDKQFATADTSRSRLSSSFSYRGVQKHFNPVERFRAVEFSRNWNLRHRNVSGNEHLLSGGINFWQNNLGETNYRFEYLTYGKGYAGYRNHLQANLARNDYHLHFNGNFLNTQGDGINTDFFRYSANASRHFDRWIAGVKNAAEYNRWQKDTLLNQSFAFNQWEFYLKTPDSLTNDYYVSYSLRRDQLPREKNLKMATQGQDLHLGVQINSLENNSFKAKVTYRQLKIKDTSLTSARPEDHLLGRLEHSLRAFSNFLSTTTHYEAGAGLEPRKEFTYIEVPGGQGVYTWSDYNNNGVKELDEFEKARFSDQANYLRVYRPSGQYYKTHTNEFNQTINLTPDQLIKDTSFWARATSKLSNQLAFRIRRKNRTGSFWKNLNPFAYSIQNPRVLSQSSNIRNTLSFNRNNPVYHIDFIYMKTQSKLLLMNGSDMKEDKKHGIQLTWNIRPTITILNKAWIGDERYQSEFFQNKNYRIERFEESFSLRYRPTSSLRFELDYDYADRVNRQGKEKATKHRVGLEFHISRIKQFRLQGKTHFIHFDYGYQANTSIAYQMLEGLKPGKNATWSLILQKDLYKNLELNFNYSGRTSQDYRTIHSGQVELRAHF